MSTATVIDIPDREEALHKQVGERRTDALRQLAALEGTLRHLDELRATMRELDPPVTYDVDLGPIGNAAAAARRTQEAGRATTKFSMRREGEVA